METLQETLKAKIRRLQKEADALRDQVELLQAISTRTSFSVRFEWNGVGDWMAHQLCGGGKAGLSAKGNTPEAAFLALLQVANAAPEESDKAGAA